MWRFHTFTLATTLILLAFMMGNHKHDPETGEMLPFLEWFE